MNGHRTSLWRPMLVGAVAAIAVALLGGLMTDLGPWYQSLRQPAWKPPDVAFGPIWTTIFALTVVAGAIGWRAAAGRGRARETLLAAFAVNAFLNVLWSLLYFRLRRPDWALIEVGLLWLSIVVLIVLLYRQRRLAAALLLPYLAWVTTAAALNWETVRLNGPFG